MFQKKFPFLVNNGFFDLSVKKKNVNKNLLNQEQEIDEPLHLEAHQFDNLNRPSKKGDHGPKLFVWFHL